MDKSNLDFSLVIACYADAPHLFARVKTLAQYFSGLKLRSEFIFVEDASPLDDRAEIARCVDYLKATPIAYQTIFHTQNCGRGRTVQDGFEASRADIVGFIDIDLEHSPDGLYSMILRILNDECDGVIGTRVLGDGASSLLRAILSRSYRHLVHTVLPLPVKDSETGLKMFRRLPLQRVLPLMRDRGWFWDTEIVYRSHASGMRIVEHEIVFRRDPDKRSTVRPFRDAWHYIKALLHFRLSLAQDGPMALTEPNKVEGLL